MHDVPPSRYAYPAARTTVDGWFWGDKPGTRPRLQHGPLTRDALLAAHADGTIDDETLIWAATMEAWTAMGEVYAVMDPPFRRMYKKFSKEAHGFFERFVPTLRSEHTVVNLLAPPDDDEALTQPQMVQVRKTPAYTLPRVSRVRAHQGMWPRVSRVRAHQGMWPHVKVHVVSPLSAIVLARRT
jgi:hypothetical protein